MRRKSDITSLSSPPSDLIKSPTTSHLKDLTEDLVGNKSTPVFNDDINKEFDLLLKAVTNAYEHGVTMDEAEKLAAKCLGVQLKIASELLVLDIDSRMKKNGMKASRAQIYLDLCGAADKKPSDTFLEHKVNLNSTVNASVDLYERASALFENLSLYLSIFKESHVYFRGVAKGNYSG